MSVKKYKFVSPGVFISEIDNSQLPKLPDQQGPVIIGRTHQGPALRPVKVNSFSEFVTIFGSPSTVSSKTDAWREGDMTAPLYASYAAQAWLKNNSPATFVRLVGKENPQKVSGGEAGWYTRTFNPDTTAPVGTTGAGAYGLFVFPSGAFQASASLAVTGALAAVWYFNKGYVALSGTLAGNLQAPATSSLGVLVNGLSGEKAFVADIYDASANVLETVSFSLSRTSDRFIRDVFNTSPTNTNENLTTAGKDYFLGQTYERHYKESFKLLHGAAPSTEDSFGVILPLKTSNDLNVSDHRKDYQAAQTGWFFSQDLISHEGSNSLGDLKASNYVAESQPKLFKIHALGQGRWDSENLKVSITNVRASTNNFDPYGTFTVQLRRIEDNDTAIQIVEQFDNCNLNPDSPHYVAKVIGNKYRSWDTTERRWIEQGDFSNNSNFIRMEMNADVAEKITDERLLPFGVYGPMRWKSIQFTSDAPAVNTWNYISNEQNTAGLGTFDWLPLSASACAAGDTPSGPNFLATTKALIGISGSAWEAAGDPVFIQSITGTIEFPKVYPRASSSAGATARPSDAYFGADTSRGADGQTIYDVSTQDVLYSKPSGVPDFASSTLIEPSWIVSLDDVTQGAGNTAAGDISPNAIWVSGSRAAGKSITALTGTWQSVLDAGFDSFTTVLNAGFDGLDIYEKEPFNNTRALPAAASQFNSYAFNSVKMAIDSVSDAEVVEYNLAAVPGMTNTSLQDHLLSTCESRGDSLAVLDLPKVYLPAFDAGKTGVNRYGNNPTQAIVDLRNRNINSSYACAYYPWVQIQDSINDRTVWAPPSIAALGTFSSSQSKTKLWFAPAGFNRGGLTEGSAGIPVIGVREKLTSKQRDELYDANINPIASFPAEGIVIFGQKTLQVTQSALDRINVRRLMIYVKKQISRMSSGILFDQNVQATWDRFLATVNPFLEGIRSEFGLTDFKVVLDKTTTTPELIDRNILYAKIFLKPARAIEYIAIDFNITNSGAAFED